MHPSYQEARKRRLISSRYVALGGDTEFIHKEMCATSRSCCFLFPVKQNASSPVPLPPLPPHVPSVRAWLPVATHSCKAFLLLGFSLNRSEIAAPMVSSELTSSWFKKNQSALLH